MQTGDIHPNSLANLRPISPEHRSNNTGKTYKFHPRRAIRRMMEKSGEQLLERLETIGLKSEAEANAIRAIQELFNRGYGKPVETVRHSGSVDHSIVGKRLADIPDAEIPATEAALATGRLILRGNMVMANPDYHEAEFEEVKNGDSEV